MLCPPQNNLQAGTIFDEQKSYMVRWGGKGGGKRIGLHGKSGFYMQVCEEVGSQ